MTKHPILFSAGNMSSELEQRALRIAAEIDRDAHLLIGDWVVEFAHRLMAEQGEPVAWTSVNEALPSPDEQVLVWKRERNASNPDMPYYEMPWCEPEIALVRGWWVIENSDTPSGIAAREYNNITYGFNYDANTLSAEALLWRSIPYDASPPSDAQEGMVVPSEPTMGMWDDFCAVFQVPFDKFIKAYRAMLSAAPSQETPTAIPGTDENWDNRALGADERYVRVADEPNVAGQELPVADQSPGQEAPESPTGQVAKYPVPAAPDATPETRPKRDEYGPNWGYAEALDEYIDQLERQRNALQAKLAEAERDAKSCKWSQDDDGNWFTGCGEAFIISEGNPSENGMKFCCYCGHELEEAPYIDTNDDAAMRGKGEK